MRDAFAAKPMDYLGASAQQLLFGWSSPDNMALARGVRPGQDARQEQLHIE